MPLAYGEESAPQQVGRRHGDPDHEPEPRGAVRVGERPLVRRLGEPDAEDRETAEQTVAAEGAPSAERNERMSSGPVRATSATATTCTATDEAPPTSTIAAKNPS